MSARNADVLDVAIVGGGISGLYTGWRLLTGEYKKESARPKHVAVFELSGRTGGRLLTWHPRPGLNAELGGMRFFKQQQLLWSLVTNYFVPKNKLQDPARFFVGDPNLNNLWYLRQNLLKTPDLTNPDRLPYQLDARGKYADPGSILNGIISRILSANRPAVVDRLNGRTMPTDWHDWDRIKPVLKYRDRPLWDVGFWNLLWDELSPETYNYVADAFGYYSITNNWNAAEAMQSVFTDFTQNPDYHTLHEGYDHLPQLVREEFENAGGTVRLNTPVVSIDRPRNGKYQLTIKDNREAKTIQARHVILAMPRRSLELLKETSLWTLDDPLKGKHAAGKTLRQHITSVIAYPAFKLFLVYKSPWWRDPPINIAAGRSVSDMPIRQTYYFPPVEDAFPPGQPPAHEGSGLVMASYDDLNAVPFWQTLEGSDTHKKVSNKILEKQLNQMPHQGSRLQSYQREKQEALIADQGFFFAPPEMVRYAQEQLSLLHFNLPLPDPVTIPDHPDMFLAAYKDWSVDPFGGGWNFWAPLVNVEQVMEQIRQPFAGESVYIVGEAYSGAQGWVEGALTTAEKVLRDYFHLTKAAWQPNNYYLGY